MMKVNVKQWLRRHTRDILVVAALLAVAAVCAAVMALTAVPGAHVCVRVDGEELARYPLSQDRRVTLEYGGTNELVIEGGRARIESADCPDKVCVRTAPISEVGQTVVCLPHKLVVVIE